MNALVELAKVLPIAIMRHSDRAPRRTVRHREPGATEKIKRLRAFCPAAIAVLGLLRYKGCGQRPCILIYMSQI